MAIFLRWRRSFAKGGESGAVPLSREEFAKQRRYAIVFDAALIALVFLILSLDLSVWIKRLAAVVLIVSVPGDWLFDSYESYLRGFRNAQSSTK